MPLGTKGVNEWAPSWDEGGCDEGPVCDDDDCDGKFDGRIAGDDVDSEGGVEDEPDEGFWNIFLMSILGLAGAVAAAVAAGVDAVDEEGDEDDEAAGVASWGLDEMDGLPLTWPEVAGTVPKDFTAEFTGGTAAGEEDIGAEASSIDPKVTAEPIAAG